MPVQSVERKLAAIFAADIAGYSRLMANDEVGTITRLKACRVIIDGLITSHRGRIFNTAGDSVVADFSSAVEAVQCAVAVQTTIAGENAGRDADEAMLFRIGIHVGDVVVDDTNLLGDGVNIAARLEAMAGPGGIWVSGTVRDQIGNKLPLGFDDLGDQQVKNIAQPIRVYRVRDTGAAARSPSAPTPTLLLPDKPSIAVLPFQNMSGDPEQEYFVDGMVEEVITALSRIRWLFVIARNSTFTYKGRPVDVKEIGCELGVHYLLEGSVRKAGQRVRIATQLIDAITGTHLWADRFDGSLEDIFDLQDKVASSVAGVIEPTLQIAETERSAGRPTNDLTAYDLYLRAYAMVFASAMQIPEAIRLLEQAIERDPRYGTAFAWAAICYMRLCQDGRSEDPQADSQKSAVLARQALQVAGDDPAVLANTAFVLAYVGEDIGAMMALVDRALALNPNFARGWHISGNLRLWASQPDRTIEDVEKALRLSPRTRIGQPSMLIGSAHFFSRRFDEAVTRLLLGIQEFENHAPLYRCLAACYAHMGRLDDAHEIIARLRAITSVVVPTIMPYRNPKDRELFLSGLRLAMGEMA